MRIKTDNIKNKSYFKIRINSTIIYKSTLLDYNSKQRFFWMSKQIWCKYQITKMSKN